MKTLQFKYDVDDLVMVDLDGLGCVHTIGADCSGKKYFVLTVNGAAWYREQQLSPSSKK